MQAYHGNIMALHLVGVIDIRDFGATHWNEFHNKA
jgi:hypothetical protein